jgi:hypothetical protein
VAAAAVSFTLCPSDTQIPARPSPLLESPAVSTWAAGQRRRVTDSGTDNLLLARSRQLPTAESPKCRWHQRGSGQRSWEGRSWEQRE